MPIATPEVYAEMLERAKQNSYAFPAINCTSSETINAALKGFADAASDGIIQFSTGGAEFGSGLGVKEMVTGAVALAEFAHIIAAKYPINVALHTDHCPKDKLDGYVRPLLAISSDRVSQGRDPLFQSHMWDGSAVPIDENLAIAQELLKEAAAAKIILEVEIGVVGGEEDGVVGEMNEKLYSTPEDFEKTLEALGSGEHGKYLLAATFGNVHGVYKPGNVKLRPEILAQGQKAAAAKLGLPDDAKPFNFVFHGGSGSEKSQILEAVRYGVVKMNVDTDAQYAFTRPIAGHMFTNYDGVLKVDGDVGNKKVYDPRSYLKKAEASMTERVIEACNDLHCAGKSTITAS
jgi:fructose-bisphosphate aldolase, class II